MINLRQLDDQTYRDGAILKGATAEDLETLSSADHARRALLTSVEELRGQANAVSKEIGQSAPDDRPAKIAAANELKQELKSKETELDTLQGQVDELILTIPNPAHPSVPGGGEEDFELVTTVGDQAAPPPLDHADFGAAM